ncbi:hypothetical protein Y032_0100g3326 [Ancylostoma ceylanicum]|uniref:Uncharacterized protein n=1 Tax=Ancylostoma ceylanicum TaxID=53326 RepID=A0A016TIE4_9BILA|nr:hypothetical protein Y032_0100g3326 [Ancylostoma ceylanicum]
MGYLLLMGTIDCPWAATRYRQRYTWVNMLMDVRYRRGRPDPVLAPSPTPPHNRSAPLLRRALATRALWFSHVLTRSTMVLTSLHKQQQTSTENRDARQNMSKLEDYRNETVLLRWCWTAARRCERRDQQ